jgi:hypothetical protein
VYKDRPVSVEKFFNWSNANTFRTSYTDMSFKVSIILMFSTLLIRKLTQFQVTLVSFQAKHLNKWLGGRLLKLLEDASQKIDLIQLQLPQMGTLLLINCIDSITL